MEKVKIFVSYSHSNHEWLNEEGKYKLIPWLERQLNGRVDIWTDHALKQQLGEKYSRLITEKIMTADIAILLISQDFVSSKYITEVELPLIKQCYANESLKIVPLLLTNLTQNGKDKISWIFDLQTYPNDTKPLINFYSNDAEWERVKVEILEGIENKIELIGQKPKVKQTVSQPIIIEVPPMPSVTETLPKDETKRQIEATSPAKNKILLYAIIGLIALILIGTVAWLLLPQTKEATKQITEQNVGQTIPHEQNNQSDVQINSSTKTTAPSIQHATNTNAQTSNQVAPSNAVQAAAEHNNVSSTPESQKINNVVQNQSENAETYIKQGNDFDDKGDYDNALAMYQKALGIDPSNAKAYNNIGITYFNKGDFAKAITAYKKSISLDPSNAKVYYNMGNAFSKQGDPKMQIASYMKAAQLGHQKSQDWLKIHNLSW